MPLIIVANILRLVLTGYDTGYEALGLISIRRAREIGGGGLKINFLISTIKLVPSLFRG